MNGIEIIRKVPARRARVLCFSLSMKYLDRGSCTVDFTTRKIAENLRLVYESGVLEEINKHYPQALAVVLFGSYRKGDDVRESDLDLAVEVLGNEELQIIELGIITKLGYRENVKVNVHVFTRNKIDLNLFTNVANGILLQGLLEVRP